MQVKPFNNFKLVSRGYIIGAMDKYDELIEKIEGLLAAEKPLEALELSEEAIKVNEKENLKQPEGWFYKGLALYRLDKKEEAIVAFDKAININPELSEAWYNKGIVLNDFGKEKEAIVAFDMSISLLEKKSGDFEHLASAWYSKGYSLIVLKENYEEVYCSPLRTSNC